MSKISTPNYDLIEKSVSIVPDFPKPGILFRDITTLIENPAAFQAAVKTIVDFAKDKGFTKVLGTESRGFIFGAPIALDLELPFVLVRKPGKLPRAVIAETYKLEYGTDTLELHRDSIKPGDKVLVIDDLLATGGTITATVTLVKALGGVCEHAAFIINLTDLPGKERLESLGVSVHSILEFKEFV